jgi:phosphotransferase system enzyme I (PtsP)
MAASGIAVRGPRSLLRQIREAMAGGGPAQAKLDMVVRTIAISMVAEVCSIYLRRASGDLELFATEGLSRDAVHVTRMKPGEGLVGETMRLGRPLNLSDAASHPAFSYRPETGEDPYHAFLAVPLLRGGRTIGVLVVQNRTERVYDEEEVEDLQIIAMVLAEMVSAGELLGLTELKDVEIAPHKPERLKGARFAEGLAYGVAVLHEQPVAPEQLLSDDALAEEARLKWAVEALQTQIDEMLEGQHGLVGASYEVLETYRMFAHDRGWNRSLQEAVRSGLTAEAAVERVRSEHRARLGQARDPYLRERLHDLEDLNDRLLRHLSGDVHAVRVLPEDAILIARNLGPADLLEYDRTKLKGILLEEGSAASHAGIVARALDIPCVGRLAGLRDRVSEGDPVVVDAETAEAWLRPRPDVVKSLQARMEVRAQRKAEFARIRDTPAVTKDGDKVTLLMNAGLAVDLDILGETGAEGIGLFRTEFQFMVAEEMPRLEAQTSALREGAGGRQRHAGDLPHPGPRRRQAAAVHGAGARGQSGPGLARHPHGPGPSGPAAHADPRPDQGRAGPRAADHVPAGGQCGRVPRRPRLRRPGSRLGPEARPARTGPPGRRGDDRGPSLLWHLDALLPMTDFVSVGTNDLMQYLFAADRGNPRVSDRYDPLSPAALRALKTIQQACADTGTPVSVCGEMAGRPLEAFALLALGFDRLSMPPAGIGPVKQMVLSCDREAARRNVEALLKTSAGSLRGEIETLARKLYV